MTQFVAPKTSSDCQQLYSKMLEYAMKQHGDQKYDKGMPYIVHLVGVSNIASRFGYHVDDIELGYKVHVVALGHDLLEDTKTKYRNLVDLFGEEIAEAIYALTDEKGRNREEKNAKTWPEIRKNMIASIVKPCDRIFNLETSLANNSHQLKRYISEHTTLRSVLYSEKNDAVWKYMDSLFEAGRIKILATQAIWHE